MDLNQLLFRHQVALIDAMAARCAQSLHEAESCVDYYAQRIDGCREGLIAAGAGGSLRAL